MKITDKFRTDKTLFSFELLPPLRGQKIDSIFETTARLAHYNPSYINVTYHAAKPATETGTKYQGAPKRAGTVGVAAALMARHGVDVVPHLVCGGNSRFDIENTLIDLSFLGLDNVLALRGDAPLGSEYHTAADLVRQITAMNRGQYLDYTSTEGEQTDFCIGVAGYPEGHILAVDEAQDMAALKSKVDAGAQYIVTQMFFDNRKYFDFVERCRRAGINVPIVAGIKPFSTFNQLTLLPKTFGVTLPDTLVRAVMACGTSAPAIRQVGVEWATAQGRELIAAGAPALHFYTMGKSDNVESIVQQLF